MSLSDDFHFIGKDESRKLSHSASAFHHTIEVGGSVAFSAHARTGDIEIFLAKFLFLHAITVVCDDNGFFSHGSGEGDSNGSGLGVPCVVNELPQGALAGRVVIAKDVCEPWVNGKVGGGSAVAHLVNLSGADQLLDGIQLLFDLGRNFLPLHL